MHNTKTQEEGEETHKNNKFIEKSENYFEISLKEISIAFIKKKELIKYIYK